MSRYAKLNEYTEHLIDLGVEGVPALRARVLSIDQLMSRGAIAPETMVSLASGAGASMQTMDVKAFEARVDAAFKAALIDLHNGPDETCPENGFTLGMLAGFRVNIYTAILNRAGLAPEVKQAASFRPDEGTGPSRNGDRPEVEPDDRAGADAVGGRVGD